MNDDDRRIKAGVDLRSQRRRKRRDNPWARLVWGAAILAAGVIGWLDHTGSLHASDYLQWWPLVLIGLGIAHLPQRQWVAAVALVAIGMMFLPAKGTANDASSFHAVAVMGGVGRSVASTDFVGGDAVAVMGACEINLAGAKIANEAVIDVLAFWGGIDIRVPRGWRIDNQVTAILGGVVDKTDDDVPAGAPLLIIRGSAIMGGVEIKHPKR
jgi:hypothetical protein